MKRFIFAIVTLFAFCTNINAQETEGKNVKKKMNKTEMVKKMTADMVERYGLNEEQSAKLLKLNEEYAGKLRPGNPGGGPRMGGRNGNFGGPRGGNVNQRRDNNQEDNEKIQNRPRPSKEDMEKRMAEMKKNTEAYETQLKTIMTEEQYAKYSQERQKMHKGKNGKQQRSKE